MVGLADSFPGCMEQRGHRLAALLYAAAFGEFPAADGTVELLPAPSGPAMGWTRRRVDAGLGRARWSRRASLARPSSWSCMSNSSRSNRALLGQ